MTKTLFRVQADKRIGLGHLRRCLSLASALKEIGTECMFLTNRDVYVATRISALGHESCEDHRSKIGHRGDLEYVQRVAHRNDCGIIVVDSYEANESYLRSLKSMGFYVTAIDDLAAQPFACQLVINGGAQARQLPYESSSGDTVFLLGSEYALVSQEFWQVPPRDIRENMHTILILMGGADPNNLMPRLIDALDKLTADFEIKAVIGPFYRARDELGRAANDCRKSLRVLNAPESMADILRDCDIAISSGGQTLYELAAMGIPAVAIEVAENQRKSLEALAAEGAIVLAGRAFDQGLMETVTSAAARLILSYNERLEMSKAGRRIVDGQGPRRAAKIITERAATSPNRRS
jgi:UDP-2,4-diacetamido-2,4,6-trideoxy-beta-L-altropyranose hydrolase